MIMGTIMAGYFGWQWGPTAALIAGAFGGILAGLLLGLATATFGVNHIVAGFAINIIAPGVARFLANQWFTTPEATCARRIGEQRPTGRRPVPEGLAADPVERPRPARRYRGEGMVADLRRRRHPARADVRSPPRHDHRRPAHHRDWLSRLAHPVRASPAGRGREARRRRLARRVGHQDALLRRDPLRGDGRHGWGGVGIRRRQPLPAGPDPGSGLPRSRRPRVRQLDAGRHVRRRGRLRLRQRNPAQHRRQHHGQGLDPRRRHRARAVRRVVGLQAQHDRGGDLRRSSPCSPSSYMRSSTRSTTSSST